MAGKLKRFAAKELSEITVSRSDQKSILSARFDHVPISDYNVNDKQYKN